MEVTEQGFEELARRSAQLGRASSAVLEGGYNLETLPRLVEAALAGSRRDADEVERSTRRGRSRGGARAHVGRPSGSQGGVARGDRPELGVKDPQ